MDAQLLKSWAPAVFVGALIGGVLASVVSGAFLTVLFGVVALLVAINLALPRTVVLAEDLPKGVAARTAVPTAIGILSALMGIGGGTLSVPILSAFSFPVHRAIGTGGGFGDCDCGACRVRFHLGGVGHGRTSAVLIGLCQLTRSGFDLYHKCFHRPYGVTVGAFFGCARVEACLRAVFVCDVAADVVAGVWQRFFLRSFAMKMAVIGLGSMGYGMAASLLRGGHEVHGFDVNAKATERFRASGGSSGEMAQIAGALDAVVVVVLNAPQTETVLFGEGGVVAGLVFGFGCVGLCHGASGVRASHGGRNALRRACCISMRQYLVGR